MELILHIKPSYAAVFLLNGAFVEHANTVRYREDEPLYVTVLPLQAQMLPYTVKLLGGRAVTNGDLARCYRLRAGHCLIELLPRYNYVYSPEYPPASPEEKGTVPHFFHLVKQGNLTGARSFMTHELSATVDDEALSEFFAGYDDIVKNIYIENIPDSWFLLDDKGGGTLFAIKSTRGLIDNIIELE